MEHTCGHYRMIPLAPYVIRWGFDTSSDVLRRNLRGIACGQKGAVIQHPGWRPFPVDQPCQHRLWAIIEAKKPVDSIIVEWPIYPMEDIDGARQSRDPKIP